MKKLLFLVALFLGIIVSGTVMASSVSLYPTSKTMTNRESFTATVSVNPAGEKIYSVKVILNYPANKVEVTGFNFGDGWMSGFSPEDIIDNVNGVVIKTAGYPGGLADIKNLGTISFKSNESGSGLVSVSNGSMLLNGQNSNSLDLANLAKISLVINEPVAVPNLISEPVTTTTPTPETTGEDLEVIIDKNIDESESLATTTLEDDTSILRSEENLEVESANQTFLATVRDVLSSGMGITLIILIIAAASIGITLRRKK